MEELLDLSTIRYINPNKGNSGVFFVGASDWGWGPSDDAQQRLQLRLMEEYEAWFSLFRQLFPRPTAHVQNRIEKADDFVRRWIGRDGRFDHSIPRTIPEAKEVLRDRMSDFFELLEMAAPSEAGVVVVAVPDTNALLQAPDLASYGRAVAVSEFEIRLLPTVLRELDDLKAMGRTPEVRELAQGVVRRLKGLRDKAPLHQGVNVTRSIRLFASAKEPAAERAVSWLDRDNPDDRFLMSCLELQGDRPEAALVLVTGDLNLQNKADVLGMPYVDPPATE